MSQPLKPIKVSLLFDLQCLDILIQASSPIDERVGVKI